MEPQQGTEVRVRPNATVNAEVNGEELVPMYLDGVRMMVARSDMPRMQGRGALVYGPEDLSAIPAEIDALADEMKAIARRFADGVSSDRRVDTRDVSEGRALQTTMTRLTAKINEMFAVAAIYPTAESGETDDERLERLARDVAYHGWTEIELMRRYGMTAPEAQQVLSHNVSFEAPAEEPLARLQGSDEWVPEAGVAPQDREKIESITRSRPARREG